MKILMMTNTYLPHIGGVARSVETFTSACRELGHEVTVVAPEFPDLPPDDTGVLRVTALRKFNGSDFSLSLGLPGPVREAIIAFDPDIVHSHHPFLLGDSALRLTAERGWPLVFTHHTMYEHYTHYVPVDSVRLRRFAVELATGYANLCDWVVAPSASTAKILEDRGVTTSVTEVPTGIDLAAMQAGNGARFRQRHHLADGDYVVGHVGRLAEEKNCHVLIFAVLAFLDIADDARAVIVGGGDAEETMRERVIADGLTNRVLFTGPLRGSDLADAYRAMDVFVFASLTETQGMVLAEAAAAGTPLVAVDAPGAREVVADRENGRLMTDPDAESLVNGLQWCHDRDLQERQGLCQAAARTAQQFSREACAERLVEVYRRARETDCGDRTSNLVSWDSMRDRIKQEWEIWSNRLAALGEAASGHAGPAVDESPVAR